MKYLLVVVLLVYLYYEASGKFPMTPPSRTFQNMTLDLTHRGSFNITDCLKEFINCWELVKPDVICFKWIIYESVCHVMKQHCDDQHGILIKDQKFPIMESLCRDV